VSYLDSIRKEYEKNSVNLGNKFKIKFFPRGERVASELKALDLQSMNLRIKEIDLPMVSIATRSHKPYGNGYGHKSPYYDINQGNDNTFTCLITMSKDLRERALIIKWLDYIHTGMKGWVAEPEQYKYDADIYVYTMDGALSYLLEMKKVFPVSVEAQRLTVEGTAPLELSIVWAFDKIVYDTTQDVNDPKQNTFDKEPAKPRSPAQNAVSTAIDRAKSAFSNIKSKINPIG